MTGCKRDEFTEGTDWMLVQMDASPHKTMQMQTRFQRWWNNFVDELIERVGTCEVFNR